jgi:predicted heme/steroid binding protein/uncharacterized membrane protein
MAEAETQAGLRQFTPEELKEFDGKEGRPAYVAYHGRVYDVTRSRLWRNGVHVRAHNAGEDLTSSMPAAPHDDDVMEGFEVVGRLVDPSEMEGAEEPKLPWPITFSLDNHLHPIAVHFPTALGSVASVFSLASLLFIGQDLYAGLQAAAFWSLMVCALASVPALITGWVSWYFNYSAVWTPIYRIKWTGTVVLLVLCAVALLVKFAALGGLSVAQPSGTAFWAYNAILVLITADVIVLGHYGGKITFPS